MPMKTRRLLVQDTTLVADTHGEGRPLLLIHGGGEDATMLGAQAESLAARGFAVAAYDRRGTGRSGRDAWPGGGAAQHADDARGLIEALGLDSPTVVGVSSGAVIALALAARHPGAAGRIVAWEPPALGVVPGGGLAQRALMMPARRHLRRHPGDYVGAQALLLKLILGRPVRVDDPELGATRANAEAMIRDEPGIPTYRFRRRDLAGAEVTVGLGSETIPPIRMASRRITSWTGRPPVRVTGEHEVYLSDPSVLTGVVMSGQTS
jgi:pimeloyl-ACP methyl ester carboxylesterase